MKMYLVFANEPLEMEGSDLFVALFADKALAEEAVEKWNAEEKTLRIEQYKEGWHRFAADYYVEEVTVSGSIEQAETVTE